MQSTSKGGRGSEAAEKGSSPPSAGDAERPALRAISELRHPHLVAMRRSSTGSGFERETDEGLTFAQLTDGPSGNGSIGLRIRIRILLDVLSGLATLHRARIDGKPIDFVHGEVAPHNIVVGRDGVGRLIPLAASHWSDPPIPESASLGYVAPERLLGDVFDQRADVFSIGVLIWEAMAERRLFRNLRMDAIVTQLVAGKVSRPPAPPGAPWADALADVAMQALSVDPSHRWPHVGVMGAEIETITEGCLASSEEIAQLVRQRVLGDRGSLLPGVGPSGSVFSQAGNVPQIRDSSPPPISEARATRPRASTPPSSGLVVWHGPNTHRSPSDVGQARESVRPSARGAASSRRQRPSQAAITRQSRIIWTAVGVGLALFVLTVYELLDRESPSAGPSAALPAQQDQAPIAAAPPPRTLPPPTSTVPRDTELPRDTTASHNTSSSHNAPSIAPAAPTTPEANRQPARPAPVVQHNPPAAPRPVAKPIVPAAPTPSAAPAPTPAEPAPAPAPPKPKEDDFGI